MANFKLIKDGEQEMLINLDNINFVVPKTYAESTCEGDGCNIVFVGEEADPSKFTDFSFEQMKQLLLTK